MHIARIQPGNNLQTRTCNLGDAGVIMFPEDLGETTVACGPVGRVSGLGDDLGLESGGGRGGNEREKNFLNKYNFFGEHK